MLVRIIVVVICFILFNILFEPVLTEIGLAITANQAKIIRVCVAGIAIFYVWRGWKPVP